MTRPADDIKAGRSPDDLHNIEICFTVTSSEQKITVKNVLFWGTFRPREKTTVKITLLMALKAQKKPVSKSMFQDTSKNHKKPVFTADPRIP